MPITLKQLADDFETLLQNAAPAQLDFCQQLWMQHVSTTTATDPIKQLKEFVQFYRDSKNLLPNQVMSSGLTPLHSAAWYNYDLHLEKMCRDNPGMNVNITAETGSFNKTLPIHNAATRGHFHCVLVLEKAGGDLNALDDDSQNCLHGAASSGNVLLVRHILQSPQFTSLTTRNSRGQTALHLALCNRRRECVSALEPTLGHLNDGSGDNLLHYAVKARSLEIVDCCKPYSQKLLEGKNNQGLTPLACAINIRNLGIVNALLIAGASCGEVITSRNDPIFLAAKEYFNSPFNRSCCDIFKAVLLYAQEQKVAFCDYAQDLKYLNPTENPEHQKDIKAFEKLVLGDSGTQAVTLAQ